MSWDIIAQDLPRDATSVSDIPDDFEQAPLGIRSEIIARIKEVVPQAEFSDPAWGAIDGGSWSIEVGLGDENECTSIALHVRGADEAAGVVAAILGHLGLRALDMQTGEFFAPGAAALESLRKWREYRDRVVE